VPLGKLGAGNKWQMSENIHFRNMADHTAVDMADHTAVDMADHTAVDMADHTAVEPTTCRCFRHYHSPVNQVVFRKFWKGIHQVK
jgi:hypothetical protein